jgi:co-chaperonin GroES (HSP10)
VKVKPLGTKILIERLEGHGIERTTPGGIIIPATCERRAEQKRDAFRARVEAIGPEADKQLCGDLAVGMHVLVHTWGTGNGEQFYSGTKLGGRQLLIEPEDIVCAVHPEAHAEVVQSVVK